MEKLIALVFAVLMFIFVYMSGGLDDIINQVKHQPEETKKTSLVENVINDYLEKNITQKLNDIIPISVAANESLSLGKYQLVKADESQNDKLIAFTKDYFNFLSIYRDTDQIPEIKKYHSEKMEIPDMIFADWWATRDIKVEKFIDVRVLNSANGKHLIGSYMALDVAWDDNTRKKIDFLVKVTLVDENGGVQVLKSETTPASSVKEFLSKVESAEKSASPQQQTGTSAQTAANEPKVEKYTPQGGFGGNYNKVKELDNATIKSIVSENDPKTVAILIKTTTGGDTIGSGFFVKSGILATNFHVINNAKSGVIRTVDGKTYEIDGVVTADSVLDMAILKLKDEIGSPVKLGDPLKLEKVDPVLAIGSPLGLYNTVTVGLFNNIWKEANGKVTIQCSLPLAPGNSGGPLFNVDGEVIGINTAIQSGYADISFAGSIDHLRDTINKLGLISFKDIISIPFSKVKWTK